MAQMDYFRRPILAGKSLKRLKAGSIRGTVRRTNPDGFSNVPYFPGVVGGDTLEFRIFDGISAPETITVTFTGSGFLTVIADINTEAAGKAKAFDSDGVLGIRSLTEGSSGYIQITGGTATAKVGFDIAGATFLSTGGDLPSAPEAGVGNAFGAAFLARNENLSSESINRALGRIAGNMDALYSDLARQDSVLRQTNYTPSTDRKFLTLPSTVRVPVGLGILANNSSKQRLASYFFLTDTTTHLPAPCRVIAVLRGEPGGSVPYANATSWGSLGNVLGQDLVKAASTAITGIRDGRVIFATGAAFIANGVLPGDFVQIASATNVIPFSNNGYRWVVEEVLSADSIAVRPMSKSEMALVGTVVEDSQPLTELNEEKTSLELYGNVTVKTGAFCSGVTLVVDPPLPSGVTYSLFATQSISHRDEQAYDAADAHQLSSRVMATDQDLVTNGFLVPPTAVLSGGNCVVTAGYARWNSLSVGTRARTFLPADFTVGVNYVYWDQVLADVVNTVDAYKVFNSPGASPTHNFLIATVIKAGVSLTSVTSALRKVSDVTQSLTVGDGGQFSSFEEAVNYANAYSTAHAETAVAGGTYPHFDILLLSNTAHAAKPGLTISAPGIRIRGANPDVTLSFTGITTTYPLTISSTGSFEMADLILAFDNPTADKTFMKLNASMDRVKLENVRMKTGPSVRRLMEATSGSNATITYLYLAKCQFNVQSNMFRLKATYTSFIDSKVTITGQSGVDPQLFSPDTGIGAWSTTTLFQMNRVVVDGAGFTAFSLEPIIIHGSVGGVVHVEGCTFVGSTNPTIGFNNMLVQSHGTSRFHGNFVYGRFKVAFKSENIESSATDNVIACQGGYTVIQATNVVGNRLDILDALNNTDFQAGAPAIFAGGPGRAMSNIVIGRAHVGIMADLQAKVIGNHVNILSGANLGPSQYGIAIGDTNTNVTIQSNFVFCQAGSGIGDVGPSGTAQHLITDNTVVVSNTGQRCIDLRFCSKVQVSDNYLYSNNGSNGYALYVETTCNEINVQGNYIDCVAGWTGIRMKCPYYKVTGNYVKMDFDEFSFALVTNNEAANTGPARIITDNFFDSNVKDLSNCVFENNYVGNYVNATNVRSFSGNRVSYDATFIGTVGFESEVSRNDFFGAVSTDDTGPITFFKNLIRGDFSSSINFTGEHRLEQNHFTGSCDIFFGDSDVIGNRFDSGVTCSSGVSNSNVSFTWADNIWEGGNITFSADNNSSIFFERNVMTNNTVTFNENTGDGYTIWVKDNRLGTVTGGARKFDGNTVNGSITLDCLQANNNRFFGAVSVSSGFFGPVSFSGNFLSQTFGAAGPHSFTNCNISSCHFNTSSNVTFDGCNVSACTVSGDLILQNSKIDTVRVTGTTSCTTTSTISNCGFDGAVNLNPSTGSFDFHFVNCTMAGAVTHTGIAGTRAKFSNCTVNGTMTLGSGGTRMGVLMLDSCRLLASPTMFSSEAITVTDCKLEGSTLTIDSSSTKPTIFQSNEMLVAADFAITASHVIYEGNHLTVPSSPTNRIQLTITATHLRVVGNTLCQLFLASSLSGAWIVDSNRIVGWAQGETPYDALIIKAAFNGHGNISNNVIEILQATGGARPCNCITFGVLAGDNLRNIGVTNNRFKLTPPLAFGVTAGLFQGACLNSASGIQEMTIVGNTFEYFTAFSNGGFTISFQPNGLYLNGNNRNVGLAGNLAYRFSGTTPFPESAGTGGAMDDYFYSGSVGVIVDFYG